MVRRCRLLLVFSVAALLLHASVPGRAQVSSPKPLWQYVNTVWHTADGLPQDTINKIIQTHDGYIWAATPEGLTRFDGVQFTIFDTRHSAGLSSNNILDMVEDGAGNLWVQSPNSLCRYRDGIFTNLTPSQSGKSPHINRMYLGPQKNLLVESSEGLWGYDGERLKLLFDARAQLGSEGWRASGAAPDGALWVGGSAGSLFCLQNGVVTRAALPGGHRRDAIMSIGGDRSGTVWIGSGRGLFYVRQGRLSLYGDRAPFAGGGAVVCDRDGVAWILANRRLFRARFTGGAPHLEELTARLALSGPPNSIRLSGDGRLMVLSGENTLNTPAYSAISLFQDGRFRTDSIAHGLSGPASAALCDQEGNIWVGTETGLDCLRDTHSRMFTTADGLPSNGVISVFEDREDRVWAGTDHGLTRLQGERFVRAFPGALPVGKITSIQGDRSGALWVLCDGVVYRCRQGRVIPATALCGLAGRGISAIAAGPDGGMWFAGQHDITQYRNGVVTRYGAAQGMPPGDNWFFASFTDGQGRLWLSASAGVLCLTNGRIRVYGVQDGLPDVIVTTMFEDISGSLWFGHWGGGLTRFKDGRFRNITSRDGLFADGIFQMQQDGQERLWIGSTKGIFWVNGHDLDEYIEGAQSRFTCHAHDVSDNLAGIKCYAGSQPASCRDHNGRLWFTTLQGLVRIDQHAALSAEPQTVVVDAAQINGRSVIPERSVVARPGAGNLEFHYSALCFQNARDTQFSYQLAGFDADWVEAGTRHVAYYTNVPPGRYWFRVRASSPAGDWVTYGAATEITLRPYLYQTLWFRVVAGLGLVLFLTLVTYARGAQLRRYNRALEARVEARTQELTRAHEDLQALHEEVQAQNEEMQDIQVELEAQNEELHSVQQTLEIKNMALEAANSRLRGLATTDGLTNLLNHRAFQERLAQEWSHSTRYGSALSLLLMDVDHFKKYNDTFGHPAGDEVLKAVGQLLLDYSRDSDCVARYGGEEFVVILPTANEATAMVIAERFRAAIADHDWPRRAITVSVGVVTLAPWMLNSADLIARADEALYYSKEGGRNQVTHHAMIKPAVRAA